MFEPLPILFVVSSIVLILTPGQDLILVMSRSISQGKKAGVMTAAGVSVGLLGHTVLATFGLGALLQTSQTVFTAMKIIGAAYLLYLGWKLFSSKKSGLVMDAMPAVSMRRIFSQGALSNLSNPKIAIFYFAYLPQFVPTETANPAPVLFALGASFALLTFVIKGPLAYGAGMLSRWLRARPVVVTWINRTSGCILVGLGFRLLLEKRS